MDYSFSSLENKNVLITGGSGAIGIAIAQGFVQVGANVILWGHRSIEHTIVKKVDYYEVELESKSDIENKFDVLIQKYNRIDILINCAGYTSGTTSENYEYDKWNKTIAINLTAPFLLSQLYARQLISQRKGGSIVNITSIGAELGFPKNPAYVATKGGLKQLSKGLACDWAQYDIRVNNVGPGYTRTKMTLGSWENEELRTQRNDRTMLMKWALPEDIVGTVLFLSSDMAQYITGADIYVDAGWTAKGL